MLLKMVKLASGVSLTLLLETFYRNFVSPRFLERFAFVFHIYLEDDQIHASMIKLFRLLNTRGNKL